MDVPAGERRRPEQRWSIECEDMFGRQRGLTVFSHAGWVVVVAPAGESAVLSRQQVEHLTEALDATGSLAARTRHDRAP